MFRMFLEAIEESLDCSDNDEEALFAICLLYAAIGNKGELSFFLTFQESVFCAWRVKDTTTKTFPRPLPLLTHLYPD